MDIVLMSGVGAGLLIGCFCELLEYFRRSQLVESVRLEMGSSSTAKWEFFLGEQGEVDIAFARSFLSMRAFILNLEP